jgi:hypothetical protein
MTQMQKLLHKSFLTLDGITRVVVRPEHSMPCGSTGPISIIPGCPDDRLGLFRRVRMQSCAFAKKLLTRFEKPCDVPLRSSGITRSSHPKKKKGKKHECYRYQKGNRGNVGKH